MARSQPPTSISQVNVTCDWPASTAATTSAVCGVVKAGAVYFTELAVQWWRFMQINVLISHDE